MSENEKVIRRLQDGQIELKLVQQSAQVISRNKV